MNLEISEDTFNLLGYSEEQRISVRKKLSDIQDGLAELAEKTKAGDDKNITEDFFALTANSEDALLPLGLEWVKLKSLAPENLQDLVLGAGFRSTTVKKLLGKGMQIERNFLKELGDFNGEIEAYTMAFLLGTPYARWSKEDIKEYKNDPSIPEAEKKAVVEVWQSFQTFQEKSTESLQNILTVAQKAIQSEIVGLYQACESYLEIGNKAKKEGDIITEHLFFPNKSEAANLLALTTMLKKGTLKDCAQFKALAQSDERCLSITSELSYVLRDSCDRLDTATELLDEIKKGESKRKSIPQDPKKAPQADALTPTTYQRQR